MEPLARPKGLVIFSVLSIIMPLFTVPDLFSENGLFVSFGYVVSGLPFRVMSFLHIVGYCILAFGLLARKRWAFFGYLFLSSYFMLSLGLNILKANPTLLVAAGLPMKEFMVRDYRTIMAIALIMTVGLCLWLFRYRNHFRN